MGGIDWERYTTLCQKTYMPAIDRFSNMLRTASGVATYQSIPVFAGAMKANLVTILRGMTDILKQMSREYLPQEECESIRWKNVTDRMRETWLERLSRIDHLLIAVDYMQVRLQNKASDYEGLYRWVSSLQNQEDEIRRITERIQEEALAFTRQEVPQILELARLGIRMTR